MKQVTEYAKAVVSSQMETAAAKVDMSAHLMELLSSGIYTDKILAVVREISCNALDANITAGNDSPIDVHLPTSYELWFSVKDGGTGLSHEDIMDLYMTYGKSTKQESNEVTGFFGIGKFAPFAYTDAFTVTSWFNGEKRMYSIYKNEGIPNCTLMSTEITEQPNGLEVSVPTNMSDNYAFMEAAEKVYKGFDVKPNVNLNIAMETVKDFEADDYFLTQGYGNFFVKNGVVIYGLDYDKTQEIIDVLGYDFNYYIEVPVGSVDIAGSREKLQLTPRTKDVIDNILDRIKDETIERLATDIENRANTLIEFKSLLSNKPKAVKNIAMFNNKTLKEWTEFYDDVDVGSVEYFYKGWQKVERRMSHTGYEFNPLRVEKQTIFIKDTKVGGITEFKDFVKDRGKRPFPMFDTAQEALEFTVMMSWDDCEFVKSSDLRDKTAKKKSQVVQIEVISKGKSGYVSTKDLNSFDPTTVKKDVWFVERSRDCWVDERGILSGRFGMFCEAVSLGLTSTIFFIRSATVRKLTNPKSKMYNPHFKRFDADTVYGNLTKEEIELQVNYYSKNLTSSIGKSERELAMVSDVFTKQEKRVLLRGLQNTERSSLLKAKLEYSPQAKHTDRVIRDGIPNINSLFYTRMIEKYPFMEMCSRWNEIHVKEGMLPYIKHLVEQTDKGVFSKGEDDEEKQQAA